MGHTLAHGSMMDIISWTLFFVFDENRPYKFFNVDYVGAGSTCLLMGITPIQINLPPFHMVINISITQYQVERGAGLDKLISCIKVFG